MQALTGLDLLPSHRLQEFECLENSPGVRFVERKQIGLKFGVGAYQERSPLRVLLSAPHELYSESSVMGFCFVKSQSTRS